MSILIPFILIILLFTSILWLVIGVYNMFFTKKVVLSKLNKKANKKSKAKDKPKKKKIKKVWIKASILLILGFLLLFGIGLRVSIGFVGDQQVTTLLGNDTKSNQYVKTIDTFLQNNNVPGLIVGIIDGDESYLFAYGRERVWNNDRVDSSTIFEMGSITKVFTSMILSDSIDNDLIELDDVVSEHINISYANDSIFNNMTMKQLTTHTSGLPRLPQLFNSNWNVKLSNIVGGNPFKNMTKDKMYEFMNETKSITNNNFRYSNYGLGILGICLTEVNNQPYEEMLKSKITIPLDMKNTSVLYEPNSEKHYAKGYENYYRFGKIAIGIKSAPWVFKEGFVGAGGIMSTGEDMLKLLEVIVNKEQSFITNSMKPITTVNENSDIGMNWMIDHSQPEKTITWHNGLTGGFNSFIGIYDEADVGVFIVSNSTNNIQVLVSKIFSMNE